MNDAIRSGGGAVSAYDGPIVGLSFYTDDPGDPIAGFGEQVRLPIPNVGETVSIASEHLDSEPLDEAEPARYSVLGREFEYRTIEYDGFSGESHEQLVVVVSVEVEPIPDN